MRQDHPRGCGENTQIFRRVALGLGSPPRMRGKRGAALPLGGGMRITPAGAGKTTLDIIGRMLYKDHPRRCGENLHIPAATVKEKGSPPQVRGKLSRIHPLLHFHRITPAGAGKTGRRQRTRGYYRGSPPQVRGKPRLAGSMPHGVGITPAGAGKTFSLFSFFCRYRDHPRRCGENEHIRN